MYHANIAFCIDGALQDEYPVDEGNLIPLLSELQSR